MEQIPVVSIFRFIANARQIVKNPLPFHHHNFENKGDTFQLQLGVKNAIFLSRDAGFLQYVLQKNQRNYTKSKIQTRDLAKYIGQGLLTAEGELWRKQRRLIQPAFHKKQLNGLLDTVLEAIQLELKRIKTDTPIDIFPILSDLAFQTVTKALFRSEINPKAIKRLQFITEEAQKMVVKELRQPYKSLYFKYGGAIKKHIKLTDEARTILKVLVDERRQSEERQDDLLDLLLDARYEDGKPMGESQLIDEILILFVAGHETTSNALTFTLELLARHPEIQDKVCEESISAKNESDNSLDFLKLCRYTKQVVEESLRLYPPAYFIDRVNLEEDHYNGKIIPKSSSLLFSIIEIHRHKDLWENPEDFNPDRFANNGAQKHKAYYPFGAGPRMCIGNNFAMYEMILAITEIISKYRISSKEIPIEIDPLITLRPKNAILEFIPR